MALRPTTNLVVPDDLKLPPEELKSGFMYLYTGAFPGKEIVFISRLWASTLFPTIGNDPRFGADAKALRKGEEVLAKTTPSGYLKLKKVLGGGATGEPYFKASIPVFIFHKNNPSDVARTLNNFFLGYVNARSEKQANADEVSEIQQFADRIRVTEGVDKLTTIDYSADRLIANDKRLDANAKLQLRKCLLGMRVELKGDAAIIFLDFKITRAEAEQLTVTPWLELRNVDLYPLLLQWVASGFGSRAAVAGAKKIKTPTASFSVSKIARSLPKDQSAFARVNEHSLSIAPNGHPVWLPKTLDNTKLYEDAYSVAAMREGDDSFALLDINDAASALQQQREVQTKLPKNVPVLIDWVNNKYAYTMTNRMLKVQDLTRFRKANDSHIHGLLTTVVMEAETLNNMILISAKAGVNAANFIPKLQDLEGIQDQYGNAIRNTYAPQLQKLVSQTSLLDYYKHAVNLYAVIEGEDTVRMEDISIHGHPLFRPIARFLTALHAGILSNLAAVYEEYSVSYVSEYLGWITLISQYTHDMAGLRLRDQTLRAAAINQRVDPDWEVPSIPLAEGIPGFLPHQKKVRNLLKDSPDFAILPVQAGGGKCMSGDTFVNTDKGIMRLDEVFRKYKGDKDYTCKGFYHLKDSLSVLSSEGKYQPVDRLFKRKGDLWSVELEDGTIHKGLKEHRFYTQHGWKRIENLTEEDYILAEADTEFPQQAFVFSSQRDYIQEARDAYLGRDRWQSRVELLEGTRIPTKMTKKLAFILGALVAEGSVSVFHNTDKDFLKAYARAFVKVFGVAPKTRKGRSCTSIKAPNLAIRLFLEDIIGVDTRSSTQKVPICVLQSKKEHQVQFLRAYFEGDGEVTGIEAGARKGKIKVYTISHTLNQQVFQMLKSLGIYGHIGGSDRKRKTWVTGSGGQGVEDEHTAYAVSIPQSEAPKFRDVIGFVSSRKREHLDWCIDRYRESSNGQNSNLTSQGWVNKVPAQKEVRRFIDLLESKLDPADFRRPSGKAEYPILFKQCLTYEVTGSRNPYYVVSKGDTRYSLDMLERVVEDSRIQEVLNNSKEARELWSRIKYLKSKIWCAVRKVKANIGHATVYDFSIPTTRAWVANGYRSHNTVAILTDILLEIKANRSAPYLIMCPSTLVAQYMKEIAKFTKGKLNVIPVTTKSVVKQGFERLTQMIERAPRNTVVITDYNVLRYQPSGSVASVCYGTTGIELFPVIDLLRQFNFQYVALDESQYVKGDSARTRAAMALIVDIPKKRLASGTMAHDSPSDLANQIAMLDPTIFGSRENFNATYGEVVKGDRVIKWKGGAANAARRIMSRIKERVVVAGAMRKEWAALLPELDSRYRGVRLTPKQQEVYEIILNQILERLEQEAKKNAGLAAFFQGKGGLEQDPEAKKEADADENEGEGLEALLQVHLARLEQYLTAPARDVLGNEMLKGDDRKSPVVLEIERLLRLHIQGGMDRAHDARDTEGPTMQPPRHGKVLIFCNYVESAEEIYAQMPPDLQRMGILYKANEKTEAGAAFEKDPRIKWMVGVSSSMDTGLNLQFCSRLIRAETVWNPGTLEQGNARINRPEFNPNNDRDMIWFDTIVVDRTISTTKASRLISKVIAVAKFDNEGNHLYDDVPDVDVVPMNLDAVRELNSWSQDLKPYLEAYRELNKAQKEDYKQYRVSQGWPEKMTAADRQKLIQKFEYAEDPADAMAMVDSPYVGGLELYNSDKLGLIRVDLYLSMEDTGAEEIEFDEDGDVGEARRAAKARLYEVSKKLHGTRTYTQFGEGIIRSINLTVNEAIVDLDVGYAVQLRNSEIFISKDPNKPLHNIRQKLIAEIGLPAAAPTSDIRPAGFKFDRKAAKLAQERLKEAEKKGLVKRKTGRQLREEAEETQAIEEAISVELHFLNVNGFLGLSFFTKDSDERAQSALQALGFRPGQDFVYAEFANAQRLVKQFDLWAEKGFEIAPDAIEQGVSDGIRAMHELLKTKKIAQHRQVTKMATQSQMRNFYRIEHKANNNRKMIKPYALIEDGRAYIALPLAGQSGTRNAIKYRAPGVKWTFSEPHMSFFGQTKAKIGQMIKRILSMGIQISNVDDLRKQAAQIKQMSQTQFRKGSDVFLGE